MMNTANPNNPSYNALISILIKHRVMTFRAPSQQWEGLSKDTQDEISAILARNKRLEALERHQPGSFADKPYDAGEYTRLIRENAFILSEKSPDIKLTDLSAMALCAYATRQGFLGNRRVNYDDNSRSLGVLAAKQPLFSTRFVAGQPKQLPEEIYGQFKQMLNRKTMLESIKYQYNKRDKAFSEFILLRKFLCQYDNEYIHSVLIFLLDCALHETHAKTSSWISIHSLVNVVLTPLHFAVEFGCSQATLQQFIDYGSHLEAGVFDSIPLLFQACLHWASIDTFQYLSALDNTRPREFGKGMDFFLMVACITGNDELASYLFSKNPAIDNIISGDNAKTFQVKYYLENANILHAALFYGCLNTAKLMLGQNINSSLITKGGVHALHLACWRGDVEMVGLLIKKTGPINSLDDSQLSPADYALANENVAQKELILELLGRFYLVPTIKANNINKILTKRCEDIYQESYQSSYSSPDICPVF